MSGDRPWCSLHVFHHGDHDDLLVRGIEPVLRELRSAGLIARAFFLRYWRGGPHVRVRFLAADPGLRATALATARAGIEDHLRRHPSPRALDAEAYAAMAAWLAALESDDGGDDPRTLRPDNSCLEQDYRPERDKYGGARGVEIAEDLFDASAAVAFGFLRELGDDRDRRLGRAFIMLLAAIRAFGVPAAAVPALLARYHESWAPYAPAAATAGWSARLARYRPRLTTSARALLGGGPNPHAGVRAWQEAVARAARALDDGGAAVWSAVSADVEDKRSFVLMNYLHTHNNRLGVLTSEEAYLGFLARHAVEDALAGG